MQGGYRLTNSSSKQHPDKPVISIITVVYNSDGLITRTLESIRAQTYPNIEHLIIDGGSKDKTPAIIRQYEDRIAFWISEKDKGIYDAMNKGLLHAKGDYVLFLNSGDEFYTNQTVEKVFVNDDWADAYYGDTMIINEAGEELGKRRLPLPQNLSWKSLRVGMVVCHQSLIIKRSLIQPFNLNYRISADIDWTINCLKKADKIVNCHLYISRFLQGGTSNVNMRKGLAERFKILTKHFGLLPNLLAHIYILLRLILYVAKNRFS